MKWDPARFISKRDALTGRLEDEELLPDTGEHFLPWAFGQRVCPGKKFSQVEIVAALAVLFHHYRLNPQPEGRETMDRARERALRVCRDVEHKMLVEMKHPEVLGLKWTRV